MTKSRRPVLSAVLSAVFMGLGQIRNRQYAKGVLYIAVHAFLLFYCAPYLYWGIEGLITLGFTPMYDHSLFLMVYGILAVIALAFIVVLYVSCIKDAYRCAVKRQAGEALPSFKDGFKSMLSRKAPMLFIAPGMAAIILIVVLPLLFSVIIGFTSYDAYHQPPAKLLDWVGLKNYIQIFTNKAWSTTFLGILLWTLLFTVLTSVLPYTVGIAMATLINNPRIRLKRVFKTIMILPWAIPSYISIMVWRGLFDTNDGLINSFLSRLGFSAVPWMQDETAARAAIVIVSIWCGFTFPMLISESIMKGIPDDLYEAARLDGASSSRCFFKITFPILFFGISPLFIMSMAGAFNNFNLIFLFNEGFPPNLAFMGAGNTDILISWIYNLTYTMQKYNYASAITTVIFIFLAGFAIYSLKQTKSFKEEDMLQ